MPPILKVGDTMIYENLKPKQQKNSRNIYYYNMLKRFINSRFTWSGLPDTINNFQMNNSFLTGIGIMYDMNNGNSVNSGIQITKAVGAGLMLNNRTFETYTTFGSDYSIAFEKGDKYAIFRNGYDCLNDEMLIDRLSVIFSEIDSAQHKILKWCKKSPIFKANSGIKSSQLKQVVTNIIKDDSDINIINDNSDIINPTSTSRNDLMLEISDVNSVQNLHFLSEFYDDMLKRFCTQFGLPFSTTSKSAQNCIDELHDMDLFSRLYNMETLNALKEDVEKANSIFNLKLSVDYSEPYKQQIEEICERVNNIESDKDTDNVTNVDTD